MLNIKKALLGALIMLYAGLLYAGDGQLRRKLHPVQNQWIVNFGNLVTGKAADGVADALLLGTGGRKIAVWALSPPAFAFEGPEAVAQAIARNPHVDFVEEVGTYRLATLPWDIDRINQTYGTDGYYLPSCVGAPRSNVVVYIPDTGTRANHAEFQDSRGSRVIAGSNFVNDGQDATNPCTGPNACLSQDEPCLNGGHGTAVASIISSNTYGVSRVAELIPVRLLRCDGHPVTDLVTLSGIDWIRTDYAARQRPAVMNISWGQQLPSTSAPPTTLEQHVAWAINEGITTVVAADNNDETVLLWTPARLSHANGGRAITVGASTNQDQRWRCNPANAFESDSCLNDPGSNWGFVDIFAPGQNVTSAAIKENVPGIGWLDTTTAERLAARSGTSFSAAIVSGVAARILDGRTASTSLPDIVWNQISATASNVMSECSGDPNCGPLNQVNPRLIYIGDAVGCRIRP